MSFNKEEYLSQLNNYQDSISLIREGRAEGQKMLFDQRSGWRSGVLTVSFGISAAFMAAGPNITFFSLNRKILFWISALLFLFVGLFVMIYIKDKLDNDSNEVASIMMEQEYYLLVMRNLYREALFKGVGVDNEKIKTNTALLQERSKEEARHVNKNSKKIQIVDDVWSFLLVFAFYFLGFSFVPLHHSNLGWYILLGIVMAAGWMTYFKVNYTKAKAANKKYREWREKLDGLTYV